MTLFEAAVIGFIQGLTEFIPVSSSGHVLLSAHFFGLDDPGVATFNIVVHAGTLLAVLVVLRDRIKDLCQQFKMWVLLFWGTLPAVLAVLLADADDLFSSINLSDQTGRVWVSAAYLLTGLVLLWEHRHPVVRSSQNLTWPKALLIGLGQMVAIIPGVSRSGMTMAMGRFCHLNRQQAFEFSFLLAIPAIGGGLIWEMLKVFGHQPVESSMASSALAVGFVSAAITGTVALKFLRSWVDKRGLGPFGLYCLVLAALVWVQS